MEVSNVELLDRYNSLDDYELLELYKSGTLAEEAMNVLNELIEKRSLEPSLNGLSAENSSDISSTNWSNITKPFPKVWLGYVVLTLYVLLVGLFLPEDAQFETADKVIIRVGSLIVLAYWLFCIHRLHWVIAEITNNKYPISPGKASGFHLIPIYNLYWSFKWPRELGRFLRIESDRKTQVGTWLGVIVCLGLLLSSVLIGYILLFLAAGIVSQEIKKVAKYKANNTP